MEFETVTSASSALGAAPSDLGWIRLLVIAPVLEELVFRSGLHEALLRRRETNFLHSPALANAATAAVFSLCHFAFDPSAISVLTVIPALAIGWIYQRTRRVLPCIATHAAFNAVWFAGGHLFP
jgi:membrane protease YdiL (CAAX protease family)